MALQPLATTEQLAFCTSCGLALDNGICPRGCGRIKEPPGTSRSLVTICLATAACVLSASALVVAIVRESPASGIPSASTTAVDPHDQTIEGLRSAVRDLTHRVNELDNERDRQADSRTALADARRSVFTILTGSGSGSGFVVRSTAHRSELITNFHVVAEGYVNGDREVKVRRNNQTLDGTITDASESNDLAVIRIHESFPALRFADEEPSVGDPVMALGSPIGLGGTVTSGIVSAFREEQGLKYLQFSAPISPGNSGGPVIDAQGRVVGVAVLKYVGDAIEGVGFAIPTDRVCVALDVCR